MRYSREGWTLLFGLACFLFCLPTSVQSLYFVCILSFFLAAHFVIWKKRICWVFRFGLKSEKHPLCVYIDAASKLSKLLKAFDLWNTLYQRNHFQETRSLLVILHTLSVYSYYFGFGFWGAKRSSRAPCRFFSHNIRSIIGCVVWRHHNLCTKLHDEGGSLKPRHQLN